MKRIVILSLILLAGQAQGMASFEVQNPRSTFYGAKLTNPRLQQLPKSTTAETSALPTLATAAAGTAYNYSAILAQIKANVPVIIASVKVLVPKVQSMVSSASTGGFSGLISSVVQGALDSSTREAVMNLATKVGQTINAVVGLKNAPTSVKEDAKGILSAITKDEDIQKLLAVVKGVPFVGTLLSDKLNELIGDITQL